MALGSGDLGRRLTERRRELGLSLAEVAHRAGMAEDYLAHLETDAPVHPSLNALRRLATALRTNVAALEGGGVLRVPGGGRRDEPGALAALDLEQCRHLIEPGGVGRVAVVGPEELSVLPVNYRVVDGDIVFRTDEPHRYEHQTEDKVAFEVDRIDDALAEGWSVVARGPIEVVHDEQERARLLAHGPVPWAGGKRDVVVRIRPQRFTGRRIRRA